MNPSVCVVHLVRAANGWAPFARFMDSYECHPAGIPHDLVAVCKGFPDDVVPAAYRERLAAHGEKILIVPDVGFDIGSYWTAARKLDYSYFCFLNSYSVILDDGWLAKLADPMAPTVGLIGASGSWQSHNTFSLRWIKTGARLLMFWRPMPGPDNIGFLTPGERGSVMKRALRALVHYTSFPNPHVRTNAFLIRRDLMLDLRVGPMATKEDAWRFESGRLGLTRQVRRRKLATLVVGRDGVAYPPERWPESHTYRSGDQKNLLVSDNRTDEWVDLPPERKEESSIVAWGQRSVPGWKADRTV